MPISGTARSDEASVARHYDALDRFYREIWGEHVHHGLWTTGRESVEEATRALVDVVARWARARPGAVVADAGCGYGGTARILAGEHGCEVVGFTLSAAQAARVLQPGGRLVVVDWFARERPTRWQTRLLLGPIAREGRLPSLCALSDYERWAAAAGLRVVRTEDLSARARRTWSIVGRRLARRLAADADARRFLLSSANPDRAFGLSLARIPVALRTGAMQLALLAAERQVVKAS